MLWAFVWILIFASCTAETGSDARFVISELQASNRTGLMAEDGELYDWIEVRNASAQPASLRGYSLSKDSMHKSWTFPDTLLQPGQCVVVFATKADLPTQLHCDFKLSADGDTLQLHSPSGRLVTELPYEQLKADQVLMLNEDSVYETSFRPSPGRENDAQGYQEYLQELEAQRTSPLRIWEYARHPKVVNVAGKARSWVEVKNVSRDTVRLSHYVLAEKVGGEPQLSLPERRLAPGELFVMVDTNAVLGTKTMVLLRDGRFADGVNARKAYAGVSVGRQQGKAGFLFMGSATPGAENEVEAYEKVTPAPKFSRKPGAYAAKNLYIKIRHDQDSGVHYTLDGTLPTTDSPLFRDSLLVDTNMTIRMLAIAPGELPSEVVTGTFIVGVRHSLPVVSLTVDKSALFDPLSGICSLGPNAAVEFPNFGANFWKPWERPAHVEFCDSADGFSYDCGIKVFGGFSRARPKKSFQIKFRARYGQGKLHYDLYQTGQKEAYNSFVLRSGSQDDIGVMVRDEFFTSLMAAECPTLLVQAYRPVVLYINGEYWGIYFIREKINKEFVGNHLGTDPDRTQLLMQQHLALEGSSRDYISMVNYAIQHDMRDSVHFAYMSNRVDFESLIDFKLGEFYCSNTDAGNIRYCRSTDPVSDGKWRWIFYDLDASFFSFEKLSFYIRGTSLEAPLSSVSAYNVLINRLLDNPQFRELFLQRWAYHRKHTFEPEHAQQVFDQLISVIEPEMPLNCKRWPNMSLASWRNHVSHFRQQLHTRLPKLHEELLRELQVTEEERHRFFE